jgi:hypothetical protein
VWLNRPSAVLICLSEQTHQYLSGLTHQFISHQPSAVYYFPFLQLSVCGTEYTFLGFDFFPNG